MKNNFWIAALLGFAIGCSAPPERGWHEEDGYRWRSLDIRGGKPGFEPVQPKDTGILFDNRLDPESFVQNRVRANGSGVAAGDVDGDGLVDLYFARLQGPNALYRNLGNWKFADITQEAGVACSDRYSTGAAFADVDGDGDVDLLVAYVGAPVELFVNDGSGRFHRVEAGLSRRATGGTTLALADVDGDSDLDLYTANYKRMMVGDSLAPDRLRMAGMVQGRGSAMRLTPPFDRHYRLVKVGDTMTRIEVGEEDALYLNDGFGRFQAVPFTGGAFLDEGGRPLKEAPRGWGLTARFQDLNGDGRPDLYVANDFETPDDVWLNRGGGVFQAVSQEAIRKTSNYSMSVATSDINGDGRLDLFVPDMLSIDPARRKRQVLSEAMAVYEVGSIPSRTQVARNTLQLNRGDGIFFEIAQLSGVEASDWTWGSLFLDVDLDGYEDLLLGTGHLHNVQDGDHLLMEDQQMRRGVSIDEIRRLVLRAPDLRQPNVVFRNSGDLTFERIPGGWGIGAEADISHGLVSADLDGDGDLDIVINRLNDPAGVYRNTAGGGRVAVRLRGRGKNTQAVGARAFLRGGPVDQMREVVSGGHYLSSADPLLSFAASSASMHLEIVWPDGARQRIDGIESNRLYVVDEPAERVEESAPDGDPPAWFEDRSPEFQHTEAPFDDFKEQPLLPWRMSQGGPGLLWTDLDDDGDEDLVAGTGRGGRLAVMKNEGGTIAKAAYYGPVAGGDLTGLAAWHTRGGLRILAGRSNEEGLGESELLVYGIRKGLHLEERLPFGPDAIGAVILLDLERDGDLDVFAAGRFTPGRYPVPASSVIYENADGRLRPDGARSAAFLSVGLISDAAAEDVDLDGDDDLILADSWGPIRIFLNDAAGGFDEATSEFGLAEATGVWNGLGTGDFDGDGRVDFIATNSGWNTGSGRGGRRLYYGDMSGRGSVDLLEATFREDLGSYAPDYDLLTLIRALPQAGRRITSFGAYGAMTVEEVAGTDLSYREARTLSHTLFLNRSGRFEAVPLPLEAQTAPAFAAVVADFNLDGSEDVFLSQNTLAVRKTAHRQDAGAGIWLAGDGSGTLRPLSPSRTGINTSGAQRGAAVADFDSDGYVDLAIAQNGDSLKLFRGQPQGRPGLRVFLSGSELNPQAVGARIRPIYRNGKTGPVQRVGAGSHWSYSATAKVFGRADEIEAIEVTWPNGSTTRAAVPRNATSVTVRFPEVTAKKQPN